MPVSQPANFNLQEFSDIGQLLVGGRLYTYGYGTTSHKTAFTDPNGVVPHTYTLDGTGGQYIALNARGELPAPLYLLGDGSYDITLKRADGSLVWTRKADGVDNAANNGIAALKTTMASSDGPGGMGFDFEKNYVANTIGWAAHAAKRGLNVLRYIPPEMWPAIAAGNSTDNHRPYLQAAYNAASKLMERDVYHPAGKYNSDGSLYCGYDAALNPGYNIDRNGEITLSGDGVSSENGGSCGTVLNFTMAAGDGLVVSLASEDALPFRSRDFRAHGISFQGSTSGFLVLARGVPGLHINDCEFIQRNADGGGLWATTTYFGVVEKSRFQNRASGTKTSDAIKFGTNIAAGLLSLRDLNVSGYANGLNMYAGDWQLLSIVDSELAGTAYGIYANGNIQVLNCTRAYFEGACTSFIADTGSNRIKNLVMTGCWSYGAGLTGPAINLAAPNSVQISGSYSQDQNTTYLNIQSMPSGGTGGYMVQGVSFPRTVAAPAPVTLFTGMLPEFHGVDYASGDLNVKLHDPAKYPLVSRTNFLVSSSYQSAGHQLRTSMKDFGPVAGGSIDLQGNGFPAVAFAYCTTATTTIYLPSKNSGIPHSFNHMITNAAASTQPLTIRSAVADGEALIGTVAPGAQRTFFFFNDGTATGWK